MKNLAVILGLSVVILSGCNKDETTTTTPVAPSLTEQEKTDLLFLREEEKLARDVYLYAYDLYGQNIHQNIANSEQSHMDQVLVLLEYYGLPDPASNERGVFSVKELQDLYDALTTKADSSVVDGFLVGATIEDLDIRDIVLFENNTTKTDLLDMYAKLVCGSRNHMRGFNNQLVNNGVTYTPQFITQDEFDAIINGDHETCN